MLKQRKGISNEIYIKNQYHLFIKEILGIMLNNINNGHRCR